MTTAIQMELFNGTTNFTCLPMSQAVRMAVDTMALAGIEERGAIYTKREVVNFILNLVGYTPNKPLETFTLLEPSFGHGDFLIPAVERLCESIKDRAKPESTDKLKRAIRAVELHKASFEETKAKIEVLLEKYGFPKDACKELTASWLATGDFLLTDLDGSFTHIVGNPPYVRQELIPDVLIDEYRRRFETVYDRADIYIPFIEKSLKHLTHDGRLGFICSDRWTKNKYGSRLRKLISQDFHLKYYIDMVDTPAFHTDVIAYPAIMVITREKGKTTKVAYKPRIDKSALASLHLNLERSLYDDRVVTVHSVTNGTDPWLLEKSPSLNLLRRIERQYPTLEAAGCKVGIGVATGSDRVFIAPYESLVVESDRKLPLITTKDLVGDKIEWRGMGVINPFSDDGSLVDLDEYPKLKEYLYGREEEIKKRHVSKKNPSGWFRTIDRIYPEITNQKKLLIPDIKGDAQVVYEDGNYYPHHNLYYIVSDNWDLRVLQMVLMSGIAQLFVSAYSTKMHGGFLRFQAQYLRRIRIPHWSTIRDSLKSKLIDASQCREHEFQIETIAELYRMTISERKTFLDVCGG